VIFRATRTKTDISLLWPAFLFGGDWRQYSVKVRKRFLRRVCPQVISYDWPKVNVRELRNLAERYVLNGEFGPLLSLTRLSSNETNPV